MSQLIRMRQRIKAIKTIKKITHALRLISMSTHLRLRSRKNTIEEYKKTLSDLYAGFNNFIVNWHHPLMALGNKSGASLVILVGSQKGLCGNFNTELYAFFAKEMSKKNKQHVSLIAIGKKAHDYAKIGSGTIIMSFDEFSMLNVQKISHTITNYILESAHLYSSVTVYSNISKTFFSQKPQLTTVIPFVVEQPLEQKSFDQDDYIWEQKPSDIMNYLVEKLLYMMIYELLFQSLIAEQAARFIAMDNSTRSASKLLDSMQLTYNKMRQSKITGELTDLIGGFF